MYHRSYEEREPIEVRITPDDLVVLSFPGPDRSIRLDDLRLGKAVSRRYRNRRIGEFLKELDLTEGRATGIPKILRVMAANGSPMPEFESDDDRTSFLIRLPVHTAAGPAGKTGFSPATDEVTGEVTGEVAEREIEGFTGEVTGEVMRLLEVINEQMQRRAIQDALGLKHEDHFRRAYLLPALAAGLIEMTIPDKPQSSLQRYRLTRKGQRLRKGVRKNK